MDYNIQMTAKAEHDLDEILSYIMHKLCNTDAALHLMDLLEKRMSFLQKNPQIYEECHQPLLRSAHYRKASFGNYLMIYRIDGTNNTVYIERFFSEMENYAAKL